MTRDEQAGILVLCFNDASRRFRNPSEHGFTPKSYAEFVACQIRRNVETGPEPTAMTPAEALDFADALERGEFEKELGGLMGFA